MTLWFVGPLKNIQKIYKCDAKTEHGSKYCENCRQHKITHGIKMIIIDEEWISMRWRWNMKALDDCSLNCGNFHLNIVLTSFQFICRCIVKNILIWYTVYTLYEFEYWVCTALCKRGNIRFIVCLQMTNWEILFTDRFEPFNITWSNFWINKWIHCVSFVDGSRNIHIWRELRWHIHRWHSNHCVHATTVYYILVMLPSTNSNKYFELGIVHWTF